MEKSQRLSVKIIALCDTASMRLRLLLLPLGLVLLLAGCGREEASSGVPSALGSVARSDNQTSLAAKSALHMPLAVGLSRISKKRFGTQVSPGHSPVSPERFTGYHTGVDFETLPEESARDVAVTAACAGKVLHTGWTSGYGGLLLQACTIGGQPATVLYGHLRQASVGKKTGDALTAGETIGVLGAGFTAETDGERKHLHFAIHRGPGVNVRGYVSKEAQLSGWIDPVSLF